MSLFSVLIPIYNAEKYIEETIQSVLNQTEQNFELVLLDDESSDHSREICKRLSEEYPDKIRFYSQKNTGVLLARRKLAELSRGEYLLFVDADDLLKDNALAVIKDNIQRTNADVVIYDLMKKSDQGDERYTLPFEESKVFENENRRQILRLVFLTKYIYSMCQKSIRRECFDFDVNYDNVRNMRIAEDVYQSIPILDNSETIAYIKEPLYIYRKNSGGATASVKLSDLQWDYKLYDRQDKYAEKWQIAKEDKQVMSEKRVRRILGFLSVYAKQKTNDSYSQFKKFAINLMDNEYYIKAKEEASINHLQNVYKLDLLFLKFHCYYLLYLLHKSI